MNQTSESKPTVPYVSSTFLQTSIMSAIGIGIGAAAICALAVVVGTGRFVTPNARYTVQRRIDSLRLEVRKYEAHHVAETSVAETDMRAAGSRGFRALAGYIFGGTSDGSKIAMTTPVALERGDEGHVIRFFLPSGDTAPPAPLNARVRVRSVPAALMAVRSLSASMESLDGACFAAAAP